MRLQKLVADGTAVVLIVMLLPSLPFFIWLDSVGYRGLPFRPREIIRYVWDQTHQTG